MKIAKRSAKTCVLLGGGRGEPHSKQVNKWGRKPSFEGRKKKKKDIRWFLKLRWEEASQGHQGIRVLAKEGITDLLISVGGGGIEKESYPTR